jgi:hypothetical protein
MAEGLDLSDVFRRTVQANARFYQGWVDLSLEYFRGLTEIFGGAQVEPPAETSQPDTGVLVVEGEAGTAVSSAFLVTNDLGRKLTCELVATDFVGPGGTGVALRAAFEPPMVELAPGEQRVVQAVVSVDERLTPGAAYSGAFAIKGMDGFSVPVVVRRRHTVTDTDSGDPHQPAPDLSDVHGRDPAKPKSPAGAGARKRTTSKKSGARRR